MIEPGLMLDFVGVAVIIICIVWQFAKEKKMKRKQDDFSETIKITK